MVARVSNVYLFFVCFWCFNILKMAVALLPLRLWYSQCCSCLFISSRTVIYRSHYKRPQFPPKVDFGGPNYRQQRLMLCLMLTGPAGLCRRLDRPGRRRPAASHFNYSTAYFFHFIIFFWYL